MAARRSWRPSRPLAQLGSAAGQTWLFAAVWLVGALLPLAIGLGLSFMRQRGLHIRWSLSLQAYRDLIETGRIEVVLRTASVAAGVSLICLTGGLPLALWLAKTARSYWLIQLVWICLTVPFFLDPSARTLVLRLVLGSSGPINEVLLHLHLIAAPLRWLLFSNFAIILGLVGPYFPNMVWPIYLSILLIDDAVLDASRDLGAGPWATLRFTLLPLAMPGILAGLIMTFIPVLGDSVVPDLLGGGQQEYLADSVLSLSTTMNYTGAASLATVVFTLLGLLSLAALLLYRRASPGKAGREAALA